MAKRLTRREFLKLSGQAIAVTGAAGTVCGLGSPRRAAAATTVELDGRELTAKVGGTFATIQLVPRYSKSSLPDVIVCKVQYGTDPNFATYSETAEVTADYYVRSEGGRHVGPDGSSNLIARRVKFVSGKWEIATGDVIYNETDGSAMVVSRVASDTTIEGQLSGGTNNVWNTGDTWRLDRTYYKLEIKLSGLQSSRKYYYRVLLRYEGDAWPAPRATRSFRTRRAVGESFRFAIWADAHRNIYKNRKWPEWSTLVGTLQAEQPDLFIDLGDTWTLTSGNGEPLSKQWPELYSMVMRPTRNGFGSYKGVSDLCGDGGYYLVRGNHEGLSDTDPAKRKRLVTKLLKLFVPNPDGATYPQGGSQDSDYDQGYFAFEWGDVLFVAMDVVKYKEPKKLNPSPARFHIGQAQLDWLTGVLQNSPRRWKFVFMHHLFGGSDNYGRGGAAFAFQYEHAQVQALAEQYGAHVFHGHDHLLAEESANGVLCYCCGLAWGAQLAHAYERADTLYPNGFIATSCNAEPPACENNGYMVVDVTPTQVTIRYKTYQGAVLLTTVLT
jgi:hypothetical protein